MKTDIGELFTKECEQNSDALLRYCSFKISNRDTAKDLVQETFLRTWNCLVRGDEISNMRAFFYKILGNLIIDEYRKKKSVSLDQMSEGGFEPVFNGSENDIENRLDGEMALKVLNDVAGPYKEIIFMRYIEDMSLKEIAEITGESRNAVAVKVHRGLKKMNDILKENEK